MTDLAKVENNKKEREQIVLNPIIDVPIETLSKCNSHIISFITEDNIKYNINYTGDQPKSINDLPLKMLEKLYHFQKTGIEFGIKRRGRMLLFDEMGVGKTVQAIGISALYQEDWPVLIICPSSLKYNWRNEIKQWLLDVDVFDYQIQVFDSGKSDFEPGMKFYILSYDLAVRIVGKIKTIGFNFIIADEAHYMKNKEAKRTKHLVPILQKSKRLLLLSGTPICSKPVEVFNLLKALRPDIFNRFGVFAARYCDPKQAYFGMDYTGASNTRELYFVLSSVINI